MVHLDAQPAVVGQQSAQRSGEPKEIGDMRVDVVGNNKICGPMPAAHECGQLFVQEGRYGRHATLCARRLRH